VNFLFLEDLKKEMLNNFTQIENLARNHKISEEKVKSFIEEFIKKLQNEDEEGKDFKDAKRHFANWMKKEVENPKKKENPNPLTNRLKYERD
jgi:predicted acetyltransferase